MRADRPSDTAKLIARSQILASRDRRLEALVSADGVQALRLMLRSDPTFDWMTFFTKSILGRRILFLGERLLLPGIIPHYLVRKLRIAEEVEKAIASGCKQVVVIGAGFDTLGWRLHQKHPGVRFIELDHPATQQRKKGQLRVGSNFRFQALDLVNELPSSALGDDVLPTVFVMEGVSMYLTPERVGEVLRDVSATMGRGGRIVWTFMARDDQGGIGFRGGSSLISRWLKVRSEPFLWGIARDRLDEFLVSCGLRQSGLADHEALRRDYLKPRGLDDLSLAEGELISTAILL